MPCLAGVLIVVSYNMSEWRSFRSVLRGSFFDIIILLTTFFLTILVDLTIAIQVGVILSALLFMKRMSDINLTQGCETIDSDLLDDYSDLPKGISIYEISGPLFFASAKRYSELIEELGLKNKVLIIRMRHVPFVDLTGIKNLKETIRSLRKEGVAVILSGVNKQVHKDLSKYEITKLVTPEHIFDSFENALASAKKIV